MPLFWTPLILEHHYSGVMVKSTGEWNGALLSTVMRVCSVFMWVMDLHMYSIDPERVTFQTVFAHNTHGSFPPHWHLMVTHHVQFCNYNNLGIVKYLICAFKYHVFAPMGRFQLESIYLYFPPSSQLLYFSVTEVTSTPTKPVDNVVIATKGLQDRKI